MNPMNRHNVQVSSLDTSKLIDQLQTEKGALGALTLMISSIAVMYATQVEGYREMGYEDYQKMVSGFSQRIANTCREMVEEERLKRVEVKGVA